MRMSLIAVLLLATGITEAADPGLGFQPVENGYAAFDTGVFRGKVRLDGQSQGISTMVHVPTGMELLAPPGLLSYYRVLATNIRYGAAVRDWPLAARVLDDGALEVRFPPTPEHPIELTGTFRWRSADTLDLETTAKPQIAMPRLEVFLSNYFVTDFDVSVYVRRNYYGGGPDALFLRADWSELVGGNYLMFPRNDDALRMIFDGRWTFPPNPVVWAFTRYMAEPIAVRRHAASGMTAALMARPEDCFALATPYNKQPPDNVSGHTSLYMSLLGRDVAAGETARASCRLVIAQNLSDETILERYKQFAAEPAKQ